MAYPTKLLHPANCLNTLQLLQHNSQGYTMVR